MIIKEIREFELAIYVNSAPTGMDQLAIYVNSATTGMSELAIYVN